MIISTVGKAATAVTRACALGAAHGAHLHRIRHVIYGRLPILVFRVADSNLHGHTITPKRCVFDEACD